MTYVDGFLIPIKKDKLKDYLKMAKEGAKMWKKYGALDYKECVGDDMTPDMGGMKIKQFPSLANTQSDETVIFSYIVYRNRKHRDQVNKKVMQDPSMNPEKYKDKGMPFDMHRMAFGGFKVIVDGK